MSIDITFHFKSPQKKLSEFIYDMNNNLGLKFEYDKEVDSWKCLFINFDLVIFQDYNYESEDYDSVDYDTILFLKSWAGHENLREIQENLALNLFYSICYLYKISGNLVSDDGYNWGKIGYFDKKVFNLDTNINLSFPKIKDLI
jgi:hypothetical protein